MSKIIKLYLKLLMLLCFDKDKFNQIPTKTGKKILKYLPHISIKWDNGQIIKPYYLNKRWLLRCYQGFHEPALENFIINVLQKGDCVIDVGAQFGLISVLLGKVVGNNGKVYSFEPSPYNYEVLNKVIIENNLENVSVYNNAIGNKKGLSKFHQITPAGFMKIEKGYEIKERNFNEINEIRIDDFCIENNIGKVDFIKIDVDGTDYEAIIGAERLLGSNAPPIICFEVSRFWEKHGYEFNDAINYLIKYKYKLFYTARKTDEMRIINSIDDIPNGWGLEKGLAFNCFAWIDEYHFEKIWGKPNKFSKPV
jgi:FkbM family methyltransferase